MSQKEENKMEWDPKYGVDIEEIDNHQKKMFELFNMLIDLKLEKGEAKAFAGLISDINDYGKLFFASEERILKKKGYPDYETHIKKHRKFIKNTINLRREIVEDVDNLTMESILELRDWLVKHIEESDSKYTPFLRIHQYIEDVNPKK
ncbi:bacteriohemerythrin [Desulfospira joergensenii]|uniref:bacteriohemerythrin n=1 Tax=Desulfospira joergensenii TaxID=53329 RepID=UPI0003B69D07|nr:bacteriohemerythrin [Desulfospira joergensenii]